MLKKNDKSLDFVGITLTVSNLFDLNNKLMFCL